MYFSLLICLNLSIQLIFAEGPPLAGHMRTSVGSGNASSRNRKETRVHLRVSAILRGKTGSKAVGESHQCVPSWRTSSEEKKAGVGERTRWFPGKVSLEGVSQLKVRESFEEWSRS